MDFAELLTLVAEIDGIARIRFTTSHPVEFSDALIQAFADVPQLCSQVHLPVQSGSDRILAAMKRGHTVLEYRNRIRRLREARPDIAVSSDFIVGFPGETAGDFARTLELVEQVRFDGAFCFLYSPRPGTPAAALPNDTPLAEREQRLATLLEHIGQLQQAHARAMVGRDEVVLVTGPARRGSGDRSGRTSSNRVVNFACADATLDGTLVRVHIDSVWSNSLRGSLIGPTGL